MSAETPLIEVLLQEADGIRLFFKDESAHPTGSLKHRLARSLYLDALCSGRLGRGMPVFEASSGSTAVSAAYFARLLGLDFVAVVPAATSPEKIELIRHYAGRCQLVDDPRDMCAAAADLARASGGCHLDQFTFAERATDWRAANIGESICDEVIRATGEAPHWIVCGAGTGGTATTIGRHLRYRGHETGLCVVDPEASVLHRHYANRSVATSSGAMSRVEGIGRPVVPASFMPDVVDRMIAVPDAESFSAAHRLSSILGRRCGPSTGTNLRGALALIEEMRSAGQSGSVVTLICDTGDRYASTCFDDRWLSAHGIEPCDSGGLMQRYLPLTS